MLKRVFWKHHHGEDSGESSDSDSDSGSDPGSTLSENEIQEKQGIRQNSDDSEGCIDSDGSQDESEESEGGSDNDGGEDESEDDMEDDEDDSGTSDAPLGVEAAEQSDGVGHAGSDSDEEPAAQTWQQFLESRDAEEEEEEGDSEDEDGLECFRSTAEPLELLAQGDILRCFACGVLVLNAAAYSSHVASKKHARKVAKWPGSLHGLQPVVKASAVEGKYEAQETHAERLERMRIEAEEAAQKAAGKIAGKKRQRSKVQAERKRPGKRQRAELRAAGLVPPPKKHKLKTPGDGPKQGPSVRQGGPSLTDVPSTENSRKVSVSKNGQHSGKRNVDAPGKDGSKRAFTPAVRQQSSKHNNKPLRKKAAATPWSAVTNKNGANGQSEAAKQQPAAVLKSTKQPQSVPAVPSAKHNVHMPKQKLKKKLSQ